MATPTPLNLHRDASGGIIYGADPTNTVQRFTLTANTEQHFTMPASSNPNTYIAAFAISPGSNVFVGFNGVTATVPGGVDTVSAELNPQVRMLVGGTVVSLITPDTAAYVTIAIWTLTGP